MRDYINQFLTETERPLLIRDPVHNYIELTPIEKDLIDTQIFQRLRFVTQNSTVFYTYPANRSSRFEHSIGAAYLAGRFVAAALKSRRGDVVHRFLGAFDGAVETLCGQHAIDPSAYVGPNRRYSSEALVWQTARLVAALHDLGHLPFSHLTEHAIAPHYSLVLRGHPAESEWQKKKKGGAAYHEFMGLMLVGESEELAAVFADRPQQPRRLLLELVRATFEHSIPILETVYSLMSGEIDVDRSDYIARDGRNSGVEFGNYDVTRLADFMRLHEHEGVFSVVPLELALSSVESFFAARYQLYKWVIFHHHVAATDTALQHAIDMAMQRIADGDAEAKTIFDIRRLRPDGLLLDGTYSDDVWMWSVLRRLFEELHRQADHTPEDRFFLRLLECCLHRAKMVSLWKTPIEFRDFSSLEFDSAFRAAINSKYKELHRQGIIEISQPEAGLWSYYQRHLALNLVAEQCLRYDYLRTRSLEQEINRDRDDFRILLEPKRFSPAKSAGGAKLLTKMGSAPRVADYSATVRALPDAWAGDTHLFAFAVPLDGQVSREAARARFIEGFIRWYRMQPDLKFPGPEGGGQ